MKKLIFLNPINTVLTPELKPISESASNNLSYLIEEGHGVIVVQSEVGWTKDYDAVLYSTKITTGNVIGYLSRNDHKLLMPQGMVKFRTPTSVLIDSYLEKNSSELPYVLLGNFDDIYQKHADRNIKTSDSLGITKENIKELILF